MLALAANAGKEPDQKQRREEVPQVFVHPLADDHDSLGKVPWRQSGTVGPRFVVAVSSGDSAGDGHFRAV